MVDGTRSSAFRPALSKLRRLSLLGTKMNNIDSIPLKLNHDVLATVMTFLDHRDLFNMMCTSRTFYNLGLSIFLTEIRVTGTPWTGMPRYQMYRRYLLQDTARFSRVRSLCSTYKALDDNIQHPPGHNVYRKFHPFPPQYRLTDFLPQLINLEVLDVTMEGANVTPSFCLWIRTLSRLRVLKLHEVGPHVQHLQELLPDLPSNMKVLHLTRSRRSVVEGELDPVPALERSWKTLESLVVDCYDRGRGPRLPREPTARLPAVRELSWVSRWGVQTGALMAAFPHVRTLRVGHVMLDTPGCAGGAGVGGVPEFVRVHMRERNLHAQDACAARWPGLERLAGALLSLWTLALRCPVARVETCLRAWERANVGHLVVLLHDTRPRELALTTYPEHLAELDRILNFPTLESFELRLDVMHKHDPWPESMCEPDLLVLLRSVFDQVYQSRLRRLTLVLRTLVDVFKSAAYRRACRRGDLDLKRPPPTQRLNAKWRAFADGLFVTLPLLEELTLELWGHRTLICTRHGETIVHRESTEEVCPWDPSCMSDEGIWLDLLGRLM